MCLEDMVKSGRVEAAILGAMRSGVIGANFEQFRSSLKDEAIAIRSNRSSSVLAFMVVDGELVTWQEPLRWWNLEATH